ncbi:PREDICTED: fibroblast growth factor receptor 2-like isoform X2 [Branchiostoma belcheri]|uniref:Fibroblast growth factor receptor 2-like isoform X2 n=1 Tax=Branchiostoma belcheri TaxID=7741 RepID=A0A6P4XRI5_BRABE|nr:PREDICTED: fibroblast growth factor receptor 2-like isoform X2 [Branchiostoma belcheri]
MCDCRLRGQMDSARLRNAIQGNPTCSSPPHMEGVALAHVGTFPVCHGHGDCTPGEDTCDCNVGWTGPYCDKDYNVALGKIATQSYTYINYLNRVPAGPEKAVDGSMNSCALTGEEFQPWWKVDLAGYYAVKRVSVMDGHFFARGKLFLDFPVMVRVGPNEDFTRNDQCGLKYTSTLTVRPSVVLHCERPLPGRYVSVQIMGQTGRLGLCEVEVYVTDICCDDTIGIANGQITANDGFCFGKNIQFSCNPGYDLVGDSWTTCQKNGSWDREVPTCKRICCDNTIMIPNGQVTSNDGYCSGNAVHFSCDAGYELVGSSFTICQDEGWDREFPTCQRICCDNTTEITNGLVNATDGYCFGNDISFSCNPGYELVGTPLTTCQEDGSWSREIPTCQPHAQTVPEEQSMEATIAGASASVVAVLIVVSAVLMVLLRRRRRKRKDSTVQVSYFLPDDVIIHNRRLQELAAAPPVPDRPELPGFEVDPSRVTLGQRIGSGAFGLAYRATLTTGDETEDVVVKTLKDAASEEDRLSFLQEIRAVVALGVQDNVLSLVGCCTVVRDHLYLITEFMPYGDLKNFLRKCRQEEIYDEPRGDIYNFEVKQMYQVARQIARGMDHISRSRYIHGDLAARNVLVGEELKVKISDFGLAEDIYTRGYRRQDRLQRVPWKWMAPERLEDGKAYTSQSDVWSFGIVLYEISTLGGDPYPDVAIAHLKDRLQAGFRMPKPEGCPPGMYDLMLQCWRWQPAERPSFRNLELDLDSQLAFYGPEYARTAPATGTAPKPIA